MVVNTEKPNPELQHRRILCRRISGRKKIRNSYVKPQTTLRYYVSVIINSAAGMDFLLKKEGKKRKK